jgi:hypothetical protein
MPREDELARLMDTVLVDNLDSKLRAVLDRLRSRGTPPAAILALVERKAATAPLLVAAVRAYLGVK